MPTFKLPLSGDVVQSISPWTAFMSPVGNQLGLINVTIGQSSDPAVEADTLSDVASYGKQLGRIEDALVVLLAHFHPATPLSADETKAIDDLKEMLDRIAEVKEKHKRKAMRLPAHHSPAAAPSSVDGAAARAAAAAMADTASPPPSSPPTPPEPPPAPPNRPSRRPRS